MSKVHGLLLGLLVMPQVAPVAAGAESERGEVLVARAFVPSPQRRVGEVRLVRRDGEKVVQTLLYTKLLDRVVREIVDKEKKSWPRPIEGHADSVRYLDALRAAAEAIPRPDAAAADRRRRLLIEFRVRAGKGVIEFATFATEGLRDDLEVRDRRQLTQIEVSPEYAARNMDLIAADSFDVPEPKVGELWKGAVSGAE